MHTVDRLLCSYRGLPRPHGDENDLKQTYFEFWDSIEVIRINMFNPEWWSSAYRSSLNGVLTLPERLPFNHERGKSVWIGSDATLSNCAAVDRTHRIFTVFETAPYIEFLSELTDLPRGDCELIAITEFLILIAFLIVRAVSLVNCVVCYVGDSQNVATWMRHRKPGNRATKYFARILNRLENEYNFTATPAYISTLRNKLQDHLSRLDNIDAISYGIELGMSYVDVGPTVRAYLCNRMGEFSSIPPADNSERVRTIMQFVEKRILRHAPRNIMESTQFYAMVIGANKWGAYTMNERLVGTEWAIIPWPSECQLLGLPMAEVELKPGYQGQNSACVGTVPHT